MFQNTNVVQYYEETRRKSQPTILPFGWLTGVASLSRAGPRSRLSVEPPAGPAPARRRTPAAAAAPTPLASSLCLPSLRFWLVPAGGNNIAQAWRVWSAHANRFRLSICCARGPLSLFLPSAPACLAAAIADRDLGSARCGDPAAACRYVCSCWMILGTFFFFPCFL